MEKLVDLHEVHLEEKLNLKGEKVIGRLCTLCYLQHRERKFQCVLFYEFGNLYPGGVSRTQRFH